MKTAIYCDSDEDEDNSLFTVIQMRMKTTIYCDSDEDEDNSLFTVIQMEDEDSSDSEVLEDDFKPVQSNLKKFGRAGTKNAAVEWFKETQTYNVLDTTSGRFAEWFHGIISRKWVEKGLFLPVWVVEKVVTDNTYAGRQVERASVCPDTDRQVYR